MIARLRTNAHNHPQHSAGWLTFARNYALKSEMKVLDRPQYLFLRTALQVHGDNMQAVKNTYNMISNMRFMPASPILFNSGLPEAQLSSCFLLSAEPEMDDIFNTLSEAAEISRGGGGIGLGLQSIPCQGYVPWTPVLRQTLTSVKLQL